jgi:putative heme-binding domain-containing protein
MAADRTADVAELLLPRLRALEPAARSAAIETLLSRADWTKALLRAVASRGSSEAIASAIEPAARGPLLKNRDPEIARLAEAAFGRPSRSRAAVIAEYADSLRLKGDPTRGATVFERECKACHKIGDRGFPLGPDLAGSPSADPAALLANILDPNASVPPSFLQYTVVGNDGRSYSGIIAAETATSLTLRRGDGAEDNILRAQVAEVAGTGMSLMPEDFQKTITKSEMADLIAFLRSQHRGSDSQTADADDRSRPLDIGTLPGLIEPEDRQ